MLAPPPDLSQRATSFIASQCQGIHQMPFIYSPHSSNKAFSNSSRRKGQSKTLSMNGIKPGLAGYLSCPDPKGGRPGTYAWTSATHLQNTQSWIWLKIQDTHSIFAISRQDDLTLQSNLLTSISGSIKDDRTARSKLIGLDERAYQVQTKMMSCCLKPEPRKPDPGIAFNRMHIPSQDCTRSSATNKTPACHKLASPHDVKIRNFIAPDHCQRRSHNLSHAFAASGRSVNRSTGPRQKCT